MYQPLNGELPRSASSHFDVEHCDRHLAILSETEGTGGVREVPDSVNLIYHMDQIYHHDFKYID